MRALEPLGRADLPAEVQAVPLARRYVRDLLDRTGHKQTDDALLLVTELFTNAIRHSDSGRHPDGRVSVAVANHNGTLHIDVIDAGSAGQVPQICPDVDPDSSSRCDRARADKPPLLSAHLIHTGVYLRKQRTGFGPEHSTAVSLRRCG